MAAKSYEDLRLAHDLGYADTIGLRVDADEVARMLNAYARAVSGRLNRLSGFGIGLVCGGAMLAFYSLLASRFSLLF